MSDAGLLRVNVVQRKSSSELAAIRRRTLRHRTILCGQALGLFWIVGDRRPREAAPCSSIGGRPGGQPSRGCAGRSRRAAAWNDMKDTLFTGPCKTASRLVATIGKIDVLGRMIFGRTGLHQKAHYPQIANLRVLSGITCEIGRVCLSPGRSYSTNGLMCDNILP